MAQLRACQDRKTEKQTQPLRDRACSEKHCIYRLNFSGKRGNAETYSGSGFVFIQDEAGVTVTGDAIYIYGARLIDSLGRATIVGQCGGTACGTYYTYIRGPLKGAEIQGDGSRGYLLTLPK